MIYDQFRHLADSWGLVFMSLLFLSFIGWTFRKGAGERHKDAANSIFRDEDNG
jgi:cytochrome c oxidase cbb3-type subunit IV